MKKIFRTETLMHYSAKYKKTKETEITDIEIDYNDIHIKSVKTTYTAPRFSNEWKAANSSSQEKQTNIENIYEISYEKSKGIKAIYITGIIIFALLMVFFSSREIIANYTNWFPALLKHIAVDGFFSILWLMVGLPISMLWFQTPSRAILIKFKDGDKICFPYYKYKSEETIKKFIEEVKEHNKEIRVSNKRKITDLKIIFIICLVIGLQLYFGYNSRFEKAAEFLDREISAGNYYTTEEFAKLKFLKTDKIMGYNIYENVKTKEKIRIKEEKTSRNKQEYNFLLIKYFSKSDEEKLIGEKYCYLGTGDLQNEFHITKDGNEYYFLNGKLYKFHKNVSENKAYYRIEFYDNEKIEKENWRFLNKHKLYDFIYSNENFINNSNNNYKSFERKEVLNTDYGKAYIVKADEYMGTSHRWRCLYLFYLYRN